ncbi:MAG: hypothetical protein K0R17_2255 [Rariglobus sp.]|jgi:hypothetical protein|nr:hypothetical protein [Microvirga sp.]MDF3058040.1 hypothetical protein [Rariglobus sp.]
MKNTSVLRLVLASAALAAAALFAPSIVNAQAVPADALLASVADPAAPTVAAPEAAPLTLQQSLIAVLTPLIIAGIKLAIPKIPRVWLPIMAPFLGMLIEYISHLLTGSTLNVWAGLALGAAGVGLREAVTQIKKAGPPAAA